jgi:hypothetical protein
MFKRLYDELMLVLLVDVHNPQERLAMLTQVFVRKEWSSAVEHQSKESSV